MLRARLVKIDLITDWGRSPVHVELSHGRYSSLGLKTEDDVFIRATEGKKGLRHGNQDDELENSIERVGIGHSLRLFSDGQVMTVGGFYSVLFVV